MLHRLCVLRDVVRLLLHVCRAELVTEEASFNLIFVCSLTNSLKYTPIQSSLRKRPNSY